MINFEFNRHSSALKQRLRNVFLKHEKASEFNISKGYSQTLRTTLETLRTQEKQFGDFLQGKQKEIDSMEPGIIKSKLQGHLDRIAVLTYQHFSELTDKYLRMLNVDNDEGIKFKCFKN